MFVVFRLVALLLLFTLLDARRVNLHLPDKFDVKVSKQWSFYDGKLMTEDHIQRENSREIIFHFDRGKFTFKRTRSNHR